MQQVLLLTVAISYCAAGLIPETPHREYGVPLEYLRKPIEPQVPEVQEQYGVPLARETTPAPVVHEEYGVPHEKYGVPLVKEAPTAAPVLTQYEYVIPKNIEPVVPKIHEEYGVPNQPHEEYGVPIQPHEEYGVPQVKEIVTSAPVITEYNYVIPKRIEPVAPKIHEEYGVPHEEYGVPLVKEAPTAAPVLTQYEYVIPKNIEPVVPKIHEEYGVPNQPHEEYGVPIQPHEEYGVPQVKEVAVTSAPVITEYNYVIPKRIEPVAPKIHEEYGVPHEKYGVPHDQYGVPEVKEYRIDQAAKPVEIQYEYNIPRETPKVQYEAPVAEYGVPKLAPVVPHAVYGVPAQ